MNLEISKKVIVTLLLLVVGVFLIRAYWTWIVSAMSDIWKMLAETRIRYVILAFLIYLLSVHLFAIRWQKVLSSMGYNLKATDLFPILFGAIFVNNLTPANRARGEPLRIFWTNKRFGISCTDSFITILFERLGETIPVILLLLYMLYLFPSLEIKYLLPVTLGELGIVKGGLISLLLYFGLTLASVGSFVFLERFISYGLTSLIGFLHLFYYGGFKIWKNIKLH